MFRKAVTYTYGALALIPTGLSVGSAVHWASGDENKSRAWALWAWSGWVALPYSVLLFALTPPSLVFDPVDRKSLDWVQRCWARATLYPFIKLDKPPPVSSSGGKQQHIVVSNHQSALDILILLACVDDLHFVSKQEVFYIPLVGWVMGLIGHVALARGDRQSGKSALENCERKLAQGSKWSVVFFAEGKRSSADPAADKAALVGSFKVGAFKLAASTGVDILPVTIVGSGRAMPPGQELGSLDCTVPIQVKIHAPISPAADNSDGEVERLKQACWDAVNGGLVQAAERSERIL